MTLMKRGDNGARNTVIHYVQFQFSLDDGKTWHYHEKGKWYPTGQEAGDTANVEREIKIDPPMNGNAFRVALDH